MGWGEWNVSLCMLQYQEKEDAKSGHCRDQRYAGASAEPVFPPTSMLKFLKYVCAVPPLSLVTDFIPCNTAFK